MTNPETLPTVEGALIPLTNGGKNPITIGGMDYNSGAIASDNLFKATPDEINEINRRLSPKGLVLVLEIASNSFKISRLMDSSSVQGGATEPEEHNEVVSTS